MAGTRVKLFFAIGPTGLEKKINEWLTGEGANAKVLGMNTTMCDVPGQEGAPMEQKIVVTVWFSEK